MFWVNVACGLGSAVCVGLMVGGSVGFLVGSLVWAVNVASACYLDAQSADDRATI